ncbi:Pentatricopeptide repeat-containing protein [Vigna angularis]|uniref:Pentatricopeptide repeat-containing protein n=1 Tax=Phaseolus angularis TaxID=3914 RepID=A0A8T0K1B3_PHAAN|nr:Pentatricopeptide repeat-containing protein [Vigna angularis]
MGFVKDVVTGSALVDMYSKFKKLDDAFKVFREMPVRNLVCWNAVIADHVQNERFIEGLKLFKDLLKVGMGVSQSTYASVFRSCAGLSALKLGTQMHGHALKTDFGYDCIVGTATLDMYAKCGRMSDAWKRTYVGFDDISLSGALTASMEPDDFTYGSVVKACVGQQALNNGMEMHGRIIKSGMGLDCFVGSALVDMYSKCGMLTEAGQLFLGIRSSQDSHHKSKETFQMMLTVAYGALLKSIKSLVGLSGNLTTSNIYSFMQPSNEYETGGITRYNTCTLQANQTFIVLRFMELWDVAEEYESNTMPAYRNVRRNYNRQRFAQRVHSIDNELEDSSQMRAVVQTALVLCSSVYVMISFFGFLLFGEGTLDDVLANFDTNLGIPFGSVLNDDVRLSYAAHLMLVFPVVFYPLGLNMMVSSFLHKTSGS